MKKLRKIYPRGRKRVIRQRTAAKAQALVASADGIDASEDDDVDDLDGSTAYHEKAAASASTGLLARLRRYHKDYDPVASLAVTAPSRPRGSIKMKQ
jgi:hypothetical protein